MWTGEITTPPFATIIILPFNKTATKFRILNSYLAIGEENATKRAPIPTSIKFSSNFPSQPSWQYVYTVLPIMHNYQNHSKRNIKHLNISLKYIYNKYITHYHTSTVYVLWFLKERDTTLSNNTRYDAKYSVLYIVYFGGTQELYVWCTICKLNTGTCFSKQ